jgi:cytochrome c553
MTWRLAIPMMVLALASMVAPVSAQEAHIAAEVRLCASCHGQNGLPADRTVPIISGQLSSYIRTQLRDYRSGDRDSEIMSSIAEGLSERQIVEIADYFGAARWPRESPTTPPLAPAAVAACEACHNRDLEGTTDGPSGSAPRLAGQSSPYLLAAMTAFAAGERANNRQMSTLMQSLSPEDRKAIADYLADLR